MLSGMYSAATALSASERQQEIVANNLAHINVPGFRRSVMSVETFDSAMQQQHAKAPQGHGSHIADMRTDFTPGPMATTGRSLDVAIHGEGFFAIQGPDGPLYTRNGSFHISPNDELVTSDGRPVLGDGGPITIPGGTTADQIKITASGELLAAGQPLAQLQLVRFQDQSVLTPAGTTLFSAPPDAVAEEGDVLVAQGTREQSNVAPVDELVQMIVAMRYHEAAQRALKSIDEAVQQQTRPGA